MKPVRAAIGVAGTVLNAVEIASLLHKKKTKLAFDLSLISLAVADFSVCFVLVITYIIKLKDESLMRKASHIVTWDITFSWISSSFTLAFIALQRLIAVKYPMKCSIWLTRKRCIRLIAFLWILSALMTGPVIYQNYRNHMRYIPILVSVVLSMCYAIICYCMLTRKRVAASGNASKQNFKLVLYSLAVTVAYIISTWPYSIGSFTNHGELKYFIDLLLSNTILDPIIYFLFQHCKSIRGFLCFKRALNEQHCL